MDGMSSDATFARTSVPGSPRAGTVLANLNPAAFTAFAFFRQPWNADLPHEEEFRQVFGASVKRTKWRGLVRNACIAWEFWPARGEARYEEICARLAQWPLAATPWSQNMRNGRSTG